MHLYKKTGEPLYEVPYADPKRGMRKATLKDARKTGAVPSVTEIIKIMAAPGLEKWKQDQVLDSALTLPRKENESDDCYKARIKKDSQETAIIARDTGTTIHDAIESVFKGRTVNKKYHDLANHVKDEIFKRYSGIGWESEVSFASTLGYGGKVDLTCQYQMVADVKTKESFPEGATGKKLAYDEHVMQIAAYGYGLGYDSPCGANIFVSWDGDVLFYDWDELEIDRGWRMFQACLALWKEKHRYDPSWKEAA